MPYKEPPKEYQFKKGEGGRPKGAKNFKTYLREALIEVGKALSLGETPDPVKVKIIVKGLGEALKGNYNFWQAMMKLIFGKEIAEELGETLKMKGDIQVEPPNPNKALASLINQLDEESRNKIIEILERALSRGGSEGGALPDKKPPLREDAVPKLP
jgi:hypothetical protein